MHRIDETKQEEQPAAQDERERTGDHSESRIGARIDVLRSATRATDPNPDREE